MFCHRASTRVSEHLPYAVPGTRKFRIESCSISVVIEKDDGTLLTLNRDTSESIELIEKEVQLVHPSKRGDVWCKPLYVACSLRRHIPTDVYEYRSCFLPLSSVSFCQSPTEIGKIIHFYKSFSSPKIDTSPRIIV